MKRHPISILLAVVVSATALAVAQDAGTELTLFDFEGKDTAKYTGGAQVTKSKAQSGQASLLWADHPKNTSITFQEMPQDWTPYNQITFWMYSERANDAAFMMIVRSENKESDGMDYWSAKIPVDWQGWRFFEYSLAGLGKARQPRGWDQVDSLGFTASGWGNEPKGDTVIYIDSIKLEKAAIGLRNASFDNGATPQGVPFRWSVEPAVVEGKTAVKVVDGGHEGKGLHIVDKSKSDAVGAQQSMVAEAGKKYRLSCWKKGDPIGLYLRWVDSRNQMIDMDAVKMTNKNPQAFEKFEVAATCPPDTKSVVAWIYSFRGTEAQAIVDNVELEALE